MNLSDVNKYFVKLNYRPEAIVKYYNDNKLNNLLLYKYFGFQGTPLGPHIYLKDKFINDLNNDIPIKYAGVIKLEPHTVYNWHTDQKRRVAINMLLTAHNDSHCLFTDDMYQIQVKTTELKYQPQTLYLFNTQYPHIVINNSQNRYLFSLEFDEKIDYTTLMEWTKANGYLE